MPANYVLLQRTTTSTSVASITFSNIPQTGYTDLKVVISARTAVAGNTDSITLSINGSNANLTGRFVFYNANTGGALNSSSAISGQEGGFISGNNSLANTYSNCEIYFPNYTSTTVAKPFLVESSQENTAIGTNSMYMGLFANLWNPGTQASISSLTFAPSASFLSGTTISLYGIAALGTTPEILPKATGGDIVVSDGTYWYHAFLSSGVFTPSQTLSCDVLQVAGGGGGARSGGSNFYNAGGGGAGGVLYLTSQSLTASQLAVTVGAGGRNGADSSTQSFEATNGSNSQLGALTASVGGGAGGVGSGTAGATGGSGGGGSYNGAGGSATSGQGNAGGPGVSQSAGGGGGAASAGGTGGASKGGGATNAYSSLLSVVGLGVSGFIAGGGGGGYNTTVNTPSGGNAGGGGGAGNGGISNTANPYGTDGTAATSASANTGSGGGGAPGTFNYPNGGQNGGSGGSGFVVVRYTVA